MVMLVCTIPRPAVPAFRPPALHGDNNFSSRRVSCMSKSKSKYKSMSKSKCKSKSKSRYPLLASSY